MRGLFGRLGEMLGGSPQPNPAEAGDKIKQAMQEQGLPKIGVDSEKFGKPEKYNKLQPEFTALAFEARSANSPEATKILEAAKSALQEMSRGMNIVANEKIVADAMREAKNVLSGTITPEFNTDEYNKAMEFAKQSAASEHQQKVDAWVSILKMQEGTENLSEAELRRRAEQKVAGVEEDLDDTLPGVDADESQEELRPTGT